MTDEQHDNETEIERAWERETFTMTEDEIRAIRERDARDAQTLPDVPFGDNEPAQLAAWGNGYDVFLESIETDVLRMKLRKAEERIKDLEAALRVTRLERDALKETSDPLHKIVERKTLHIGLLADRITLLEGALQSFASAAYDEDIVNGDSTDPLYSARATDGDNDSDVAIVYRTDNYQPLTVGDLRRACEVLFGHSVPTVASESEADNDRD